MAASVSASDGGNLNSLHKISEAIGMLLEFELSDERKLAHCCDNGVVRNTSVVLR